MFGTAAKYNVIKIKIVLIDKELMARFNIAVFKIAFFLMFFFLVFPDSKSFQNFETEAAPEDSVVEAIKKAALPYSAYSAFAALSGNTDSDLKEHKATEVLLKVR